MADTMLCPHCNRAGAVIDGNVSKCDRCLYWMNLTEVREIEAQRAWQREQWARQQAVISERNRQYRAALEAAAAAEEEKIRAAQQRKRAAAEKRRAKRRAGLAPSFLRDIEEALGQGMTRPNAEPG